MMDSDDTGLPDRMTPVIALLGYGAVAVLIFLMFWLAMPVTG